MDELWNRLMRSIGRKWREGLLNGDLASCLFGDLGTFHLKRKDWSETFIKSAPVFPRRLAALDVTE